LKIPAEHPAQGRSMADKTLELHFDCGSPTSDLA
jgi:hypothetical protein